MTMAIQTTAFFLFTAMLFAACFSEPNSGAAAVGVASGDDQTAVVGAAAPVPPSVTVTDSGGAPFPGAQVSFAV